LTLARLGASQAAVVRFALEDVEIEVSLKRVKNLRLVVSPPDGRVRISAPKRMAIETVRSFALAKLEWIRRQQAKMRSRPSDERRDYVDGELHPIWGAERVLAVAERGRRARVTLDAGRILLQTPPGAGREKRLGALESWYRAEVGRALPPLLALWQERIGVSVARIFVRRMKTRWGSCTPRTKTIRFNSELAKRPPSALEYIVVHELVHLLEPGHGPRFVALMDRFLPDWRAERRALHRMAP
jgi:predicted metal-dependent hydrolase